MSEPKHIADVFRTITAADWQRTFRISRPRANKLSEQIRSILGGVAQTQAGPNQRSLARPAGDNCAARTKSLTP